jgi:hypothetical protein
LTTEDFAQREPVAPDPVEQDPVDRDPIDREPAVREPADHESAAHEPVEQEPFDHESVAHEPAEHERTEHEPVDREPFNQERTDHEQDTAEPTELHAVSTTAGDTPLFTADDTADYQAEWRALQADFVDDPREAVQRADELVAQVMQTLATTFTEHKHSLEEQWQRGDEVQTEELRQALKRYRSFFDRLLSV